MKPSPSILILGTMHLDRPDNGDLLHPAPITVSDADRQQQIQTLIDVLLTFRPTKVALETTATDKHNSIKTMPPIKKVLLN